jgi:hypothetical protein
MDGDGAGEGAGRLSGIEALGGGAGSEEEGGGRFVLGLCMGINEAVGREEEIDADVEGLENIEEAEGGGRAAGVRISRDEEEPLLDWDVDRGRVAEVKAEPEPNAVPSPPVLPASLPSSSRSTTTLTTPSLSAFSTSRSSIAFFSFPPHSPLPHTRSSLARLSAASRASSLGVLPRMGRRPPSLPLPPAGPPRRCLRARSSAAARALALA